MRSASPLIFASYAQVKKHVAARAGWWEDVGRAAVREDTERGGWWFDPAHAAWIAAHARRRKATPAPPPTAEEVATAEARAVVCGACDQCKRVSLTVKGWAVYNVGCRACGCGGLSLVRGACPAGKW